MIKTVKAKIERDGKVHLLEPLNVGHSCNAIVTVIEDPEASEADGDER